jgi:hypothetical protein
MGLSLPNRGLSRFNKGLFLPSKGLSQRNKE